MASQHAQQNHTVVDAFEPHDASLLVCDKCMQAPEKLQACGATQYFCHTCNMLLSRRQLVQKDITKHQ